MPVSVGQKEVLIKIKIHVLKWQSGKNKTGWQVKAAVAMQAWWCEAASQNPW